MCHLTLENTANDGFWSTGDSSLKKPKNHWLALATNLWLLREQNQYCDLQIECDGKILNAHRIIVAAGSEYFCQMLSSNMRESVSKTVKLNCVTYEALKQILNFVYTGSLVLDEDNIYEVAKASDFLLIDSVKSICQNYILSNLSLDNCFIAKQFACELSSLDIGNAADEFILNHFDELCKDPNIGIYELDEFLGLLKDDNLCVKRELNIFDAIIQWIDYDFEQRIELLPSLLLSVRFLFMSFNDLKQIGQHSYVMASIEAAKLIADVKHNFNTLISKSQLPINENEKLINPFDYTHSTLQTAIENKTRPEDCSFLPLNRFRQSGTLICLGGRCESSNPLDFVEIYSPRADKWTHQMELPFAGRQVGIAVVGTNVYIMGGFDKRGQTLPSGILNTKTGDYNELPQMPLVRRGCAVTQVADKFIFAIGGTDCGKFSAFADVQFFDINEQYWRFVEPMLTGRRCLSAVTLDSQIYAIGGCFGDEEALCLSTVESFDVNEQRWQALPDMKTARYSCGAALLGNRIYVVGGFGYDSSNNETVPLAECEYFDTEAQTWHTVSSLQCGRGALSVVAVDGRLYAIGGFNGRYLSSVERYDPLTDSWTYCESLQQPRSGCGIAHINVDANELFIKSQNL